MRISDVGEFEFIIRPSLCARCELNQNTKHSNLQIILFGSFLNEISWDRKKEKKDFIQKNVCFAVVMKSYDLFEPQCVVFI